MRIKADGLTGFVATAHVGGSVRYSGVRRWRALLFTVACTLGMGACDQSPHRFEEDPRALILRHVPHNVQDRIGWAEDIYESLVALDIKPTTDRVCAIVAVIEQESSFQVNPQVPDMPRIAMRAIDERAEHAGMPLPLVHKALEFSSSTGRTYSDWIATARTEKDLSDIYEDFTGRVPLGRRLLAQFNPIRTRGPMQVNVAFAEEYVHTRRYPFPFTGTIENELFTRRGSLYFGIAHLLDYQPGYDSYLYRFADFNAGQYASRNAAFQNAVAVALKASKDSLTPDGALLPHDEDEDSPGVTELAIQMLVKKQKLGIDEDEIHDALRQAKTAEFAETPLYRTIFSLAEKTAHKDLPRAMVPQIELHGPKITRTLTTDWYAHRVNERFQRCERIPAPAPQGPPGTG